MNIARAHVVALTLTILLAVAAALFAPEDTNVHAHGIILQSGEGHRAKILGVEIFRLAGVADAILNDEEKSTSGTTAAPVTDAVVARTTKAETTAGDNEATSSKPAPTKAAKSTSTSTSSDGVERRSPSTSTARKSKKGDDKSKGLSPGIIVAVAFGAILATALPLVLCFYCGCVSCISDKLRDRNEEDIPSEGGMIRSSSRKSTLDCRNSECGSFHVSVDESDSV